MIELPIVKKLGVVDYVECLYLMQNFVSERQSGQSDEIWVLQHDAVFTMGAMADEGDIISYDHNVPVIRTDRGGKITFHGLGQIVIYLLLDVKRLGLNTRQLVNKLERAVVHMLSQFEIKAYTSMNNPGIYVDQYCNEKISSIGLKINKDGFSYHGISVNFDIDKEMFSHINPCGQPGLKVVNFVEMLRTNLSVDIITAEDVLVDYIIENLYHESNK